MDEFMPRSHKYDILCYITSIKTKKMVIKFKILVESHELWKINLNSEANHYQHSPQALLFVYHATQNKY